MRKLLFTLCLLLTVSWLWAQEKQSDPELFTGNKALQEKALEENNPNGPQIHLQVGSPIPYSYHEEVDGPSYSIRFPWDVPYIPLTFSEDYFEVSKGYYSGKVKLDWTIQSNGKRISQVKVYRREFRESNLDDTENYAVIATLSSDSYSYEDTDTQGGVLYEYKVEAVGVSSIPKKYVTYISGVGFRNPTGVVTGNVSFDGGSPVKDVVLRADPQGAESNFGSSVLFTETGHLSIPLGNKQLQDAITLQAWIKLADNSNGSLFTLLDNENLGNEIEISYKTTANSLELKVAQTDLAPAKTFTISDYYPTGNVDGRGDDTFNPFTSADIPQTNFLENFAHISVVLEKGKEPVFYLNGRNMKEAYLDQLPEEAPVKPSISSSGDYLFNGFSPSEVIIADGLAGHIDEIRLWKKPLDSIQIRTDFKRYLGGVESNLLAYLRCDETAGKFAYDISKIGVEFNENHARIIDGSWSDAYPTSSQLGILGVTDALGNYIISAIPYSGTGESYTITPLYGIHQFEPGQQLVFIGNGSEVINKIDFKDISSFDFLGEVFYTTNGIFDPVDTLSVPYITEDEGYNQYKSMLEGKVQSLSKGNHFANTSDPDELVIYEMPKVYVPGAHVYIDGEMVLDKNKRPVVTDEKGFFKIQVPIGEHYIEVRKDRHSFTHAGRFPAAREDGDDLFEFFEHQQTAVTFLDTTRVYLTGRVVGGSREAEKAIGFGFNGPLQEKYKEGTEEEQTIEISSVNNIGQATITLEYLPAGGEAGVGELAYSFSTHPETGEYKVSLPPLNYTIDGETGLRIDHNGDIKLLTANETLNLTEARDTRRSEYVNPAGETVFSEPYHFVKSFTYRSVPVLNVVSQSSDTEVLIEQKDASGNPQEVSISTDGFDFPVYTQGLPYSIVFETFEEYINYDAGNGNEVFDRVPITDGTFNITNNIALSGSESISPDQENPSISKYKFRAGMPSISSPFTRTINIRYRVNGLDYDARNYDPEGIILGGQSDGSQTFVTQAPDVPDIILRDPPGSNSFASIEKGESLSFTQEGNFSIAQSGGANLEVLLGTKFSAGGGLAGPVVETEGVNSIEAGLALSVESGSGKSLTKTYTFTQTISTSDDPAFVGSEADLYIGNTMNYYYGSYDNIQAGREALGDAPPLVLTNKAGESVTISKLKAFYFAEEPSATFFIYSQKQILETLIPELEGIIKGIENGAVSEETPGVLKKSFYQEQIRLWEKVIQDNEKAKYASLYDRENYKKKIKENLEKEIADLNANLKAIEAIGATASVVPGLNQIGAHSLTEAKAIVEEKIKHYQTKLTLLQEKFLKNISFDAGVGEYTNSSEVSIAQQKTKNVNVDFDASLDLTFGFTLNKTGMMLHTSHSLNTSVNSSLNEESTGSTVVTYTLKDNDPGNFLSVDVINTFDGNGPIFSTVGGRTSCPYEGIDMTLFYNHSDYKSDPKVIGLFGPEDSGNIYSGGDQISYATQQVEVPLISVEVASVTDIPETRAAEFKLILENNSVAEADANFLLYVDNTTNPHNALINIEQNGTVVHVPYGQKVEYALTLSKSISDVYEYKDIDIVLASLCDGSAINDRVTLSAIFRPSCTAVEIDRPLENWVFNAGDAYNDDQTTNPLNIALFGYDRSFGSFENFRLEYRKATSSSWTRLQTYYNTQELLDEAIVAGEDKGTLITENTTNFSWDIGALALSDGQYELRVVSNCSNGTEYVSSVIKGTVDLNVPQQFGTPTPADGILGPGQDLSLRFSENILYSSAISKIEIKGETNQQEINHNVSIYFEGADNTLTIEKPNVVEGDFSIEFWLKNLTAATAVLMEQQDGLKVALNNGVLEWTHGGITLAKAIAADGAFHHYTLTYNKEQDRLKIYQDDQDLGALENAEVGFVPNSNSLVIGGNTFAGNLHDLRFWSKSISLSEAYAGQFNELRGTERDLIGYWPMKEGTGSLAKDLARYKHAKLSAEWDIKPKGTAYDFKDGQYLELDDVNFVQLTDLMDVTLSFWMKTDSPQKATLFSNGRGNEEDLIQSNGSANKWSVSTENGILYLNSEGRQYVLSSTNVSDNSWHHVAIVLRRIGSLKTYIDAKLESSNPMNEIGGLSGNKFWVGARGFINSNNVETVDEVYSGKIDELRLWNMARSTEQIERDRFNEVAPNSIGLMLYARMNQPDPVNGNGPSYYHTAANETIIPSNAKMSSGAVAYTEDAPKIKLERPYLNFQVSHVINGDEIIITPMVSDWSVLEGQILDITIDRMFDVYGNKQTSPITWSTYVRRNEMNWFVADGSQRLSIEKEAGQPYSFELTILNKGGKKQPYQIENIPAWMDAAHTSGTLDPSSSKTIEIKVDPELSIGTYSQDLFLDTDFDFDEKLLIDLRVLAAGPDWKVDPSGFEYNMNIIGKLKIDGAFSQDPYSKVAAFVGGELRGVAWLEYDKRFDEYFLYLSIFSNTSSGEEISFKIWDAQQGKVFQAQMDGAPTFSFIQNEVIGNKSVPAIFENTDFVEQTIGLNKGWSWISIYAEDPELDNLNELTAALDLATNDLVKSQDHFDVYDQATGWNGSLTNAGGISNTTMHKVKMTSPNKLVLAGSEVDIAEWKIGIKTGWNWFAYPLSNNVSINEALSLLDAEEGDVIKNQTAFAIYDPIVGWSGTLTYLEAGDGYMLKSTKEQEFSYPEFFKANTNGRMHLTKVDEKALSEVLDWSSYEHNMNVLAEIISEEDFEAVWVVDSRGEVRGKGNIISRDGRKFSYITVFGNAGFADFTSLNLQLGSFEERKETGFSVDFKPNLILGSLNEPVVLSPSDNKVLVYPNPFSDKFHLSLRLEEAQSSLITLHNLLGHRVYSQACQLHEGHNKLLIAPAIPAGLYLLTVTIDGKKKNYKLIKN